MLRSIPQSQVRVNFTNRGLSKVVKSRASLKPQTPDRTSVSQLAKVLSKVKVLKSNPVGFTSDKEFLGLDYLGYIIEKQRLDQSTGEWLAIDEYKIIGHQASNFFDTRLAYGQVYRFRIKSIVKLTRQVVKKSHEVLELKESVRRFEKEQIKKQLNLHQDTLANLDRVLNLGLEKKKTAGKKQSVFSLLSGLTINADETKTLLKKEPVELTTSQSTQLRLLKNSNVNSSELLKGTISSKKLKKLVNEQSNFIAEEFIEYKSFYFEGRSSKWKVVRVQEEVPPPVVSDFLVQPNSKKGEISISWLQPANSQRDIAEIRVYRRRALSTPWKLMAGDKEIDVNKDGFVDDEKALKSATLPISKGVFVDRTVTPDHKYIYALETVDVHGMCSFLSTQVQAQLNPNFRAEKKEKPLKFISGSGAKLTELNAVFKKFHQPQDPVIARKSVSLELDPTFNETSKNIVVRITSLDTHEQREFSIKLNNLNVGEGQ